MQHHNFFSIQFNFNVTRYDCTVLIALDIYYHMLFEDIEYLPGCVWMTLTDFFLLCRSRILIYVGIHFEIISGLENVLWNLQYYNCGNIYGNTLLSLLVEVWENFWKKLWNFQYYFEKIYDKIPLSKLIVVWIPIIIVEKCMK